MEVFHRETPGQRAQGRSEIQARRTSMKKIQNLTTVKLFAVALAATLLFTAGSNAQLKPITISIQSDTPLGVFHGRAYREIHAFMSSNAPGDAHTKPGSYSVPIVIACPVRAHDFSGFGLVDVLNTVTIEASFAWPPGGSGSALPFARIFIGDETLFGSGVFYIAVQWDAFATGVTGGTISDPSIGNEIIRDASRVLRNPSAYLPNGVGQDVHDVIGFGYSQTASIILGLYVQGLNALPEGGLLFDGALYGGALGRWLRTDFTARNHINLTHKQYDCALLASARSTCPLDVPAFTGKVISVSAETDAVLGGFLERAEPGDPAFKNYRHYEIAGVPHIDFSTADYRSVGNPQQNTVSSRPVFRALFTSLTDWLDDDDVDGEHHNGAHHVGEHDGEGDDHGEAPPASVAIDSLNQDPGIDPVAVNLALELVRDADGNAVGGIRLPHVRTTVKGKQIGAPLGLYNGRFLATDSSAPRGRRFFLEITGTFTPFSAPTLCERYTDHDGYVDSVARGAAHARKHGWILSADAAAYVRDAAGSDIGRHCGDHHDR